MAQSYDSIIILIGEKTGLIKKEIESKIKLKIDSLSGLISKEGAAHIVAHELGVDLNVFESKNLISLKNLIPGLKNVNVIGRIRKIFDMTSFSRADGTTGKVRSMFIYDEKDSARVVLWNDAAELGLKDGDILRINKAYVKENRGNPEVNVNFADNIEINPSGVEIKATETEKIEVKTMTIERKSISQLSETDSSVEIMGTVVQAFDIRFYAVCPKCNKKLKPNNTCNDHGEVEIKYNYVFNLVIDDNTGNIRVVLFNDLIEKLFSMSREDILKYRESSFEESKTNILGNILKFTGRVNNNSMFNRLEFVARDIVVDVNFKSEIDDLKKKLKLEEIELEELDKTISEEINFDEEEIK